MEKQATKSYERVVLVPTPGFSITVAHAKFNSLNPSNHLEFVSLLLSDNIFERDFGNLYDVIVVVNNNCKVPLQEYLAQKMEKEEPHEQVTCIIFDWIMYFAESVANNLKLPSIILNTRCPSNFVAYHAFFSLAHKVTFLYKDLPLTKFCTLEEALKLIAHVCNLRASAIIWNTMDFLEHTELSQLQKHYQVPSFSIGPLHKLASLTSTSLVEEDTNGIQWMDKQALRSVIYVRLGSLATMDKKDLTEIAWGLANSDKSSLWVVRSDSIPGTEWVDILPKGFEEGVGERGCIIKWAPQKEVLAHCAVGGF
ncbi:unnamed protein product [Ilex paraguariensis]|uniref:Uncharacterized protein n=1 Tax=Ilex paraguariensis TaxID=185542 RepID=A0ABC8RR91_9AQUA